MKEVQQMKLQDKKHISRVFVPAILMLAASVCPAAQVSAQEPAEVSAVWLRDPVHGAQAVVQAPFGGPPAQVGVPVSLVVDFDFFLAPGVDVRKLDVRWSILDAQGDPLAVSHESPLGGPIVPHVWYGGGALEGKALTITSFDAATRAGTGVLTIPIGREGARSVFPSLDTPSASVAFGIGESQSLLTSQDGMTLTGAVVTGNLAIPTATRSIIVDVSRPVASLNETLIAKIFLDEPALVPTDLYLEVSVPGVVIGVPSLVTIPAGENFAQVGYAPIYTGTYQILVRDVPGGEVLGYSTMCEIRARAEFARQDVPAPGVQDENLGPFGARPGQVLTELQEPSGLERDHMTELWGTLYGMDGGAESDGGPYGDGGWWDSLWEGAECVPARPRTGLVLFKCGSCSLGVLTPEDINDEIEDCGGSGSVAGLKPARCVPAGFFSRCREENRTVGDLPVYSQEPTVFIVDCDSGAISLSFGAGIQIGGELDVKSFMVCCVFNKTGEVVAGPNWVRSCATY
jgi:hypothetical protein